MYKKNITLFTILISITCCTIFAKDNLRNSSNTYAVSEESVKLTPEKEDNSQYYKNFETIFEFINNNYVTKPDKQKLIEAAANGMLSSLDAYSEYLTEKDLEEFSSSRQGEFGGIGITTAYDNGALKVISVMDNLPAYKAGIKKDDYILAVEGEYVNDLGHSATIKKLRGAVGDEVLIKIMNSGDTKPRDIKLVRAIIKIKSVEHHIDQEFAYIKLKTFNDNTTLELKNAMSDILKKAGGEKKIRGIILDLRDNLGGVFDQAVTVSEYFLPSGVIVSTKARNESDVKIYHAKKFTDKAPMVPMVILINYFSASASEIVAAALRENNRAILIGTKTIGKGVTQMISSFKNYGIKLTMAGYYTPLGNSIHEKGIEPDINVEQIPCREKIKNYDDVFFYKFIDKKSRDKNMEDYNKIDASFDNDYQYSRAIDELKYLNTKNK
ncbi:MAG: S41 family peptidase [Rickettsiaceae bacterium]|nr:S41 family peptidase [Rickettsiaceae bacterium]